MQVSLRAILALFAVYSQVALCQDVQYFFIPNIYQKSHLNSSLIEGKDCYIGLGISSNIKTFPFDLGQMVSKDNDGKIIIQLSKIIENLDPINNQIRFSNSVHTLDLSFDLGGFRLSLGHAWKTNIELQFSKDLASILAYGNGPYIGEKLSIGPSMHGISYHELSAGVQKNLGPFSLGIRVKALSGIEAILSEQNKIEFTTDIEFYELTVDSDYKILSTDGFQYDDIDSITFSGNLLNFDNFMKHNRGFAFDIGLHFRIGENLEVGLGINDIGKITWDQNTKANTSNMIATYSGVDLSQYLASTSEIEVIDSIKALLKFEETFETFTTELELKTFLSARLKVPKNIYIGAAFYRVAREKNTRSFFVMNITKNWKTVQLGFQYTATRGRPFILGMNTSLRIGPVIWYTTIENMSSIFRPLSSHYYNVRSGLNIKL